jgi:hypothetical protein
MTHEHIWYNSRFNRRFQRFRRKKRVIFVKSMKSSVDFSVSAQSVNRGIRYRIQKAKLSQLARKVLWNIRSAESFWRRRADSNRCIEVLQTSPLATWVRRLRTGQTKTPHKATIVCEERQQRKFMLRLHPRKGTISS